MWSEVDKDELARECWVPTRPSTKQEIEQMVVHVRLWLYNDAAPCGPKAIREALDSEYHAHPLPSERTIARILARNGLTYGRTGWYGTIRTGCRNRPSAGTLTDRITRTQRRTQPLSKP